MINCIIIKSTNKYILIGPDAYPLESIKLHIAWFAGCDVAKHTARGNIAWLTGSDVRTSSNIARSTVTSMVLMVLNGRKGITYIYYIIKQLLTNVSVDMECY